MTSRAHWNLIMALVVQLAACGPAGTIRGHGGSGGGDTGGAGGGSPGTGGAQPGSGGAPATGGAPGSGGASGSGGSAPKPGSGGAPGSGGSAPGTGGMGSGGSGGATTPPPADAGRADRAGSPAQDAGGGPIMVYDASPPASGKGIVHRSSVATWEIYDVAVYRQYMANFEEIMGVLDRAVPAIRARLGVDIKLPIKVNIVAGGCCGGFAGGGEVGYNDGDFKDQFGMSWVRGVVIGEVVNAFTGAVSQGWPTDWWVNSVWYFPGFVVVDVMKEVTTPEVATKWEVSEKYPTYPVYNLFRALLMEHGWAYYQTLMNTVKNDKMIWDGPGPNPSPKRTNYVIAYMSIAAGSNLAARFQTAKVGAADTAMVQGIMDARAKLVEADKAGKNTTAGWAAFRKGDYVGATSGL
jgi:hypothetical protein